MTLTRTGERHPRVWADRDLWLPYIDILRMNLEEACSTWLGESAELTVNPPRLRRRIAWSGASSLDHGVGRYGDSRRAWLRGLLPGRLGRAPEEFVDRIEVEHVVDTTGAGDSFAAGLTYGYLAYRDYVVACQYGNAMGAQRCTGAKMNVYLSREETKQKILQEITKPERYYRRRSMNADRAGRLRRPPAAPSANSLW